MRQVIYANSLSRIGKGMPEKSAFSDLEASFSLHKLPSSGSDKTPYKYKIRSFSVLIRIRMHRN